VTLDYDVVACLGNVNTIEHVKEALSFQRNRKSAINQVKKDVHSLLIQGSYGKFINLCLNIMQLPQIVPE
jgi:hypothetical protein